MGRYSLPVLAGRIAKSILLIDPIDAGFRKEEWGRGAYISDAHPAAESRGIGNQASLVDAFCLHTVVKPLDEFRCQL
jgi:hypothetical protein